MIRDPRTTRNFPAALQRDHNRCLYCGANAECVDHIVPWCYNPDNSLANLASSCMACNLAASGDLFEDFTDKAFHILRRRGLLRAFETTANAYVTAEGPPWHPETAPDPVPWDYDYHPFEGPGWCVTCQEQVPNVQSHTVHSSRHRAREKAWAVR